MNTYGNRIVAAAAVAAIALTSVALTPAYAAPVNKKPTVSASDSTDFSSRRRYRGGNRAAFGAMIGVAGAIAGLAARDRYYDGYGPYNSGYGYGGPYYRPYGYRAYGYGAPVVRPGPWGGPGYLAPY